MPTNVADFTSKLIAIATFLDRSENKNQLGYLHPYMSTDPENLVKMSSIL